MNKIILGFGLLCSSIFYACDNEDNQLSSKLVDNPTSYDAAAKESDVAQIKFDKTTYDFGQLIDGEIVKYSFTFTNTGQKDLLIASVHTSCGCTASEYPTQAIAPGKTGKISVKFNSSGRRGFQNKSISVNTNSIPATQMLYIKANVIQPTEAQ